MAFRSLRSKIFLGFFLTVLILSAGMVLFAHTVVRSRMTDLLREKGIALAQMVAEDCITPVITAQTFQVEILFKDLQRNNADFVYAFVVDEEGREVVHSFAGGLPLELLRLASVPPPSQIFSVRLATDSGPVLHVGVPLLNGSAGVLHLGLSERQINQNVRHMVELILGISTLSLVLGILAAMVFSHLLTRPLGTLAEAAEAFGRGEDVPPVLVSSSDEIEELARVFNQMVLQRQHLQEEREQLIAKLQQALAEVKTLRGILPICSACKKIRTDRGSWEQIESYIRDHSAAEFTHGICPECARRLYPEHWEEILEE